MEADNKLIIPTFSGHGPDYSTRDILDLPENLVKEDDGGLPAAVRRGGIVLGSCGLPLSGNGLTAVNPLAEYMR